MENGNGQYKLSVESRITALEVMVKEIKDNHLKHLDEKMDRIYWLLITTFIGVIVELFMKVSGH